LKPADDATAGDRCRGGSTKLGLIVDVLDREILLLKPPVEMPDQPELDPAVDPRIAVGC